MSDFDFAELNRAMDDAAQGMVPAELKEKGWRYVDVPRRMTPEAWNFLLDWMGEGEFQCLAMTVGSNDHGPYKRGQFFISPQGMSNLRDTERSKRLAPSARVMKGEG